MMIIKECKICWRPFYVRKTKGVSKTYLRVCPKCRKIPDRYLYHKNYNLKSDTPQGKPAGFLGSIK